MKNIDEYRTTNNNSVYNKAKKEVLDHLGLIHCSRCSYNRGDNDKRKYYHVDGRRPSWKLCTKNKKQWMPKNFKYEIRFEGTNWEYVVITW